MFWPYSKMKDSGVKWLDQMPEHWGAVPLKYRLVHNDSGVWGDE